MSANRAPNDGRGKHELYPIYSAMRSRCYRENDISYPWYGAIGITVCDRWLGDEGFWNFVSDMGKRPLNASLDRIDPSKPYQPDNVRWADWIVQSGNRKNSTDHTGVWFSEKRNGWMVQFRAKGFRQQYAKQFKTFDEAVAQRVKWEEEYYSKIGGCEN